MRSPFFVGDVVKATHLIECGDDIEIPEGTTGIVEQFGTWHEYLVTFEYGDREVVTLGVDIAEIEAVTR